MSFAGRAGDYGAFRPVPEMAGEQADRPPARPAVTCQRRTPSHRERDQRAGGLAAAAAARYLTITITDTTSSRSQPGIDAKAGPDGTYVIHTTVPADDPDPATVVTACQNQAHLERDLQAVTAAPTSHPFMAAVGHLQATKGRAR